MYAVSDNGGVYKIISQSGQNTHFGDYHLDDDSKLQLLSVITDQFGNREHFTGLTAGPADVENGRYSRILFATTEDGDIYTIDQNGTLAPVLVNGQSHVNTGIWGFDLQGLAFSTLDYNLWHTTTTRGGGDAERSARHQYRAARRQPVVRLQRRPWHYVRSFPRAATASTSAWKIRERSVDAYRLQPGAANYIHGNETTDSVLLSGNESLFGSYNLPGGARAASSQARSACKVTPPATSRPCTSTTPRTPRTPTASKRHARQHSRIRLDRRRDLDRAGHQQLDAVRTFSPDAELPSYLSDSGGLYQGDKANQRIQELFDAPGAESTNPHNYPRNDFDQPLPTTAVGWRQARVDLGDLAGQSNIRLRFDFSTAGTMGIGSSLQGGIYLGASKVPSCRTCNPSRSTPPPRRPIRAHLRVPRRFRAQRAGRRRLGHRQRRNVHRQRHHLRIPQIRCALRRQFAITINDLMTPVQVADAIRDAILASPLTVVPVRDDGFTLQVPLDGRPKPPMARPSPSTAESLSLTPTVSGTPQTSAYRMPALTPINWPPRS